MKLMIICLLALTTLWGKTIVVMETNQGTIELKLFPKVAPKTVENFVTLAKQGYYDNLTFHRVIPNFMIQGGDPTGTGGGGKSIYGKTFEDEISPDVTFDRPYLLAMANAGPNTNGSQFFITTMNTTWLNGKHTIFGEVIKGQDVVKKIENASAINSRPKEPQVILHMSVKE
jgi:peptidylprolyl isomerase